LCERTWESTRDPHAIDIASSLIREIGFDPVVIGGLAMGKYLVPGTPLGGKHTAAENPADRNEPPLSRTSLLIRSLCPHEQVASVEFSACVQSYRLGFQNEKKWTDGSRPNGSGGLLPSRGYGSWASGIAEHRSSFHP
jgi:hypothetical protein